MIEWCGDPPTHCDVCKGKITLAFVDGKTSMGPWATMCPKCHRQNGTGLGTGRGQKYTLQAGKYVKVEG